MFLDLFFLAFGPALLALSAVALPRRGDEKMVTVPVSRDLHPGFFKVDLPRRANASAAAAVKERFYV